ncbi:MAG: S-methyl-5-thioribose-1-phosphate isomerase [Xylanivirga thermophila]|jgi:methylthioribose-1-phosphate isomerase|uniref:S-methyl-5-thioribose-1-phosphate isomerase n=1 Tax=Xylanivirga thermophila TaxID=2496273 RepID=UPI00101CBA59|nr:S-methyl-5-thioribose-1-phosphate isomerase [Xylanivirga thermophila]
MDTLKWRENALFLIDQTLLPRQKVIIECKTYKDVAKAIKEMNVRGAPAIGVTAAYGMVLGAFEYDGDDKEAFFDYLNDVGDVIKGTRPTAVNLFWAVDRILNRADEVRDKDITSIKIVLEEEANRMAREDIDTNRCMGHYGAQLLKDGDTVLTHCNAGALATVDYGTALGVIRAAVEEGKNISVFADETRPYLQGARLTAWELMEDNIPVTLITDNMAGYVMKKGLINAVIVGADRIAANGDVANKIGTYSVAVLAKENNIPFYVAAPISTLDLDIKAGDDIPIEERSSMEVTHICGVPIAPEGVKVMNPAFDVTPNKYITGIITEEGVIYPPYNKNLQKVGKK